MGTSYYVHLGPYVRIDNVMVDETRKKRACINKDCTQYGKKMESGTYCSICGSPIGSMDYTAKVPQYNGMLLMDHEDSLWSPAFIGNKNKYHYLLPNQHGPRGSWSIDYHDDVELDLKALDSASEIQWMEDQYPEELKILREKLGDAVHICWGLITYAH